MGDANPIPTLGDYSKPSHEGYRNTIELPVGTNVVPLRSDTIQLVQNRCSFHGLRSEDPNQHLKDFLKLVDLLDLDVENRERTRMRLFQFSLRDQASNWLERLPAGSITTWEDLTTRFLAQIFPPRRTVKLHNDILMFQQHHGESLSEAWTHFKDLLRKVPHHGGRLRKLRPDEAWATIERNTIELPVGNNVVGLVQNGCSFHGLRSEDPNQHLKDFLKLVDSLYLDGENRERTHLHLFQFSLRDQARNWLDRLPAGSITTWEDLTTRFLAQLFPPRRTVKLRNGNSKFDGRKSQKEEQKGSHIRDVLL
ncbi:zinc finger, CCHC-type containing protein [Tanacetum coccineum]